MREMNVVIADDHPIVLVGVREIVQRDARYTWWARRSVPAN